MLTNEQKQHIEAEMPIRHLDEACNCANCQVHDELLHLLETL